MKRRILLLLTALLVSIPLVASAVGIVVVKKKASDTYADLVLFSRCEALQMGAGDTYGTDSLWDGAVISSDAEKVGTNGFGFTGSGWKTILDNNGEYALAEGRVGMWLKVNTWANALILFFAKDADESDYIFFATDGSDDLTVGWKENGHDPIIYLTTTAGLATGTWYFVQLAWKQSTNYREIFVNTEAQTGASVSVGSSSTSIPAWGAAMTTIRTGDEWNAVTGSGYYVDNFMISTDSTRNLNAIRDLTSTPKP